MLPQNFRVVRDRAGDATLHGAVVAIGNFDGVHRGHKAVIATAQRRAMELHRPAAVLTFEPHPRVFFNPGEKLFRLTDEAAKLRLFAAIGLDGAIVLTFDAALAKLAAEEFVTRILLERFRISGAVIGFNFHFGAKRGGSPDFLVAQGKLRGFTVDIVPPLTDGGRPVSSGPIRQALEAGDLDTAADLLGFPWFVSGEVIHGDKRGRGSAFRLRIWPSIRLAACVTASMLSASPSTGGATTRWRVSAGGRPSITGRCCWKFSCSISPAISTASRSTSPSSPSSAKRRLSRQHADQVRQMHDDSRRAREALARAGDVFPPI